MATEFQYGSPGMCEWGRGGVTPLIFSNLPDSWSIVSHAVRELATVFSVTFFLSSSSW